MNQSTSQSREVFWLWQTKRLFPHPLFAGCISFACLLVTIIFIGVGFSERLWPLGMASFIFLAANYATAAAAFSLARERRSGFAGSRAIPRQEKPTFAIIVLLIGVYSSLLTIAMHAFEAFFKDGPGSTKYYVTLGIAIAASLFMQVYGKRVVRQYFGRKGGNNLYLTPTQVGYVVVFVMCCVFYLVWVAS